MFEFLVVVEAEPIPDQLDAVVLTQVLLQSIQLMVSKDVVALQLHVLCMHLGEDACVQSKGVVRLQRIVVPEVEGTLLFLLGQAPEDGGQLIEPL